MKKLLILFPTGNLNNNPNLVGIIDYLSNKNYQIDIILNKAHPLYQYFNNKKVNVYIEDKENISSENIKSILNKYLIKYDFIIGVNEGINEASEIAGLNNTQFGYISYEITFRDEMDNKIKSKEIIACKNIDFAVVPDKIRGEQLKIENKIPKNKMLYMPVAGINTIKGRKEYYFHEKFNLDVSKKIILYCGSITDWTMINEIINSTYNWPDDWVLVLHGRYGINDNYIEGINQLNKNRVFFSKDPIASFSEMSKLFFSADAGIAFYKPTYDSIYTGKNIKYIGLSSSKISTYLQYGLPVIINNIEPMATYVKKFNLGLVINDINDFQNFKKNKIDFKKLKTNCYNFFSKYLDLNNSIKSLEERINFFIKSKKKVKVDNNINHKINYITDKIHSYLTDYSNYKDQIIKELTKQLNEYKNIKLCRIIRKISSKFKK